MGNLIDSVIGYFSPSAKARRLYARYALAETEKHLRKYEGASHGKRTKGWKTSGSSANTEITPSLPMLRNRSRDLVRNNCYAKRGMAVIRTNTVGTGIITKVRGNSKAKARRVDAAFDAWAETTAIDYDGRNDIYGLQNLIIGTVAEAGECLIRKRIPAPKDGMQLPVQLQVIEADFLDSGMAPITVDNGNVVIQGIEFDARGRRVAYHLSEQHPGESYRIGTKLKVNRIPADEVLHIYDLTRPGQVRGVPWLAPAIIKLRDLDEYEDAQLMKQKIASAFAAFVHGDGVQSGFQDQDSTSSLSDFIAPGTIEHLPPGKEITFGTPPMVTGYQEYIGTHLRAIAIALGVTYEALTGDLTGVNFSSGRMGWLEFQRNITDWQDRIMISQFLRPLWGWFVIACQISGVDTVGLNPNYQKPRREMIDPASEVKALVQAIRAGLMTQEQAILALGGDPEKQFDEIAETNKKLDELKIVLDTDPRKVKTGGSVKKEDSSDGKDDQNA